eukprot:GHRQ01027799.1.p2 GENE.GHRQ01027799.1~~GHRQ01027799.1.p2  ORF type:complete len:129 (-),score=34.83 GHRQ01027799.1:47-433(-)
MLAVPAELQLLLAQHMTEGCMLATNRLLTGAEGIKNGLDFEQAVNDPEMVEMVSSTQVRQRQSGMSLCTAAAAPAVLAQQYSRAQLGSVTKMYAAGVAGSTTVRRAAVSVTTVQPTCIVLLQHVQTPA